MGAQLGPCGSNAENRSDIHHHPSPTRLALSVGGRALGHEWAPGQSTGPKDKLVWITWSSRVHFRSTDKTNISKFGVGLTTTSNMTSTTSSGAAAAEARHGLRHEATNTVTAEVEAAAGVAARLLLAESST